jgi:hypothetical protein
MTSEFKPGDRIYVGSEYDPESKVLNGTVEGFTPGGDTLVLFDDGVRFPYRPRAYLKRAPAQPVAFPREFAERVAALSATTAQPEATGERVHELKVLPEFIDAIFDGRKTFEARRDDRGFQVGDVLWLREWLPALNRHGGQEVRVRVTYILRGPGFGVEEGYVVMGLASPPAPGTVRVELTREDVVGERDAVECDISKDRRQVRCDACLAAAKGGG